MVDSKSKIARGLDAHERERKQLRKPRLAHLSTRPTGVTDLKVLSNNIKHKLKKLTEIREATTAALDAESARIREHYENEGVVVDENGIKTDWLKDRRKGMVDRAILQSRKTIIGAVEDDVNGLMVEVNGFKEHLKEARTAWSDPVSYLMRDTLASETRRVYADNLARAGKVELEGAMNEAMQTGNKDLGAACCSRIDSLPAATRKGLDISKHDVAEQLTFDVYQGAIGIIAISEFVVLEAGHRAREALGNTLNAGDVLATGLKLKKVAAEIGRDFDDKKDMTWLPVMSGVDQTPASSVNHGPSAEETSAKVLAEAKALSDKNARLAEAKYGSPEWVALAKELGHGADENQGDD